MQDGDMPMKTSQTCSTRNKTLLIPLLLLLLAGAAVISIAFGSVWISPVKVVRILLGGMEGTPERNIILLARLPRTCGCLLAGMALATAGAVIQTVLANPLAAPNVIGVNAGAGAAVALLGAVLPTAAALIPWAAFLGAFGAVLLVLFLSERTGASRLSLVLSGVAISAMLTALIDGVVTLVPDSLNGYTDFKIGGFTNLSMARLLWPAVITFSAILVILTLTNELDLLALGTETAHSLGLNVRAMRILLLALGAALAGAAVSFAGLLGFVGLIVPHIARRLVGDGSRGLILTCAAGGAVFVTLCDVLARVLFAPYEFSVGIVLSFIGGPFFLYLLGRKGKHGHG